jgi:DNA-binding Lrp family transcriptional regulator
VANETIGTQKISLGLPKAVARWLPARPWIHVEVSEPPWMKLGGKRSLLELHPIAPSMPDEQLADFARAMASRGGNRMGVVVSPRLRSSARAILERLGVGYADSRGHLHLPAHRLLVHLEIETRPSSVRRATPGIGPSGVRAIQALLQSDGPVSLSRLAAQVELSLSQTHAVLNQLEEAGLLRSTGTGPARRRSVADRTALLDWLVTQPSARRREPHLDVSLYARRPEELWRSVSRTLDAAGVAYAVTGAAGAALYGAGPTAVPVSLVRIAPQAPLDKAASVLGAKPTDRGPNVRLLRDTGQVGCIGAERRDGVAVAPRVRVYLDVLGEKRGEDLAEQFREVIVGH